jgi:hypothetical protein
MVDLRLLEKARRMETSSWCVHETCAAVMMKMCYRVVLCHTITMSDKEMLNV